MDATILQVPDLHVKTDDSTSSMLLLRLSGQGYGQVWFQIVQDGHIRGSDVTGYGTHGIVGSIFAMIQCSPGSQVWVKQTGVGTSWKQDIYGGHSQFGGFRIRK